MIQHEFLCENCGNECSIETFGVDDIPEFCPLCGYPKEPYEEIDSWDDAE